MTTETTTKRKSPNKLSNKEAFTLATYLLANRDLYEKTPHEWAESAASISKVLGFEITDSNLRGICEDHGIRFLPSRPGPGSLFDANEVAVLRAGVEALERSTLLLVSRVEYLERAAGLPRAIVGAAGENASIETRNGK